jgi:glutamate dehydrogenase (NAD(P)+)
MSPRRAPMVDRAGRTIARGQHRAGKNAAVTIQKLAATDAFVVFDLDGAERSIGPTRLAPRILVDGAELLARSGTYLFASFELPVSGASAGINTRPDGRDEAIAAFVAEVTPLVEAGTLTTEAARGLHPEDLAALTAASPAPLPTGERRDALLTAGVVAAAERAIGPLDGRTVALEGGEGVPVALTDALGARGATVVPAGPDAAADVLLVGSKAGVLDHTLVDGVKARAVVPWGPVPVTAKALAALRRHGVVVLPDFLTIAGPALVAAGGLPAEAGPDDVAAAVTAALDEVMDHGDGPLLGACYRAEAFLGTWRESLPFGRPIA